MRKSINRALAAALALCLGLTPALAAEVHVHTWTADWASDNICHWHTCADPDCRTLVPAWAEGYAYHVYDSIHDADCNVCGHIRAADPGHTHTWGEGWSSDGHYHWRQCTDPDCPGVAPRQGKDFAYHVYDSVTDVDCNVCGSVRLGGLSHTHTWGTEWDGDSIYHWYQCADPDCPGVTPGQAKGYGAHVYGGIEDPDCNICGQARYVDPNHTHTWGTEWDGDNGYHWYRCTDPNCPGVVPGWAKGYGAHVYSGVEDPDCDTCGKVRYVDPNHTHTWGTEWDGNESSHWYQCIGAGCPGVAPSQGKGYGSHVYDDDRDPDCNICGGLRKILAPWLGWQPPVEEEADVTIIGRGQLISRPAEPQVGGGVTVTLTPGEHYAAGTLTVTGESGQAVEVRDNGDGTWFFIQPAEKVRFRAVFLPAYQACARDGSCPLAACGDLSPAGWYHDGIHYCLDWGLMSGRGQGKFSPGDGLSGGMMAQMLYNLAGHPELPGKSAYTGSGAWYDAAVTWAVGAGVLNLDEGLWKYSPDEEITREQLAMMLWRYAGRPAASGWTRSFPDAGAVSDWAMEAVKWTVEQGVIQGRENGRLDPGGKVTRGEAAAMLVRFLEGAQP